MIRHALAFCAATLAAAMLAGCNDTRAPQSASAGAAASAGCDTEEELKAAFVRQQPVTANATFEWRQFQIADPRPLSQVDPRPSRTVTASYIRRPAEGAAWDVREHVMRFYVNDAGRCMFNTERHQWDWLRE